MESQGTQNIQPDRKKVGRPKKEPGGANDSTMPRKITPVIKIFEFTPTEEISRFDEDEKGNIIETT